MIPISRSSSLSKIVDEIFKEAGEERSLLQEYVRKTKLVDYEKTKFKPVNGSEIEKLIKKVITSFRLDRKMKDQQFDSIVIHTDNDAAIYTLVFFGNDRKNVLASNIDFKDSPEGYDLDNESDKYQKSLLAKIKKWNKAMMDIYNSVKRSLK